MPQIGLGFISNRQRRREGTFCASELAGIEPGLARSERAGYARQNQNPHHAMVLGMPLIYVLILLSLNFFQHSSFQAIFRCLSVIYNIVLKNQANSHVFFVHGKPAFSFVVQYINCCFKVLCVYSDSNFPGQDLTEK